MPTAVAEIELPISVVDAWALLTERRHTWWSGLTFDAVIDAPLTERWLDDNQTEVVASGRIIEVDPPHRLSFVWADPGATESRVDWTITIADSDRSKVTVRERGLDDASKREHEEGWKYHLSELHLAASSA